MILDENKIKNKAEFSADFEIKEFNIKSSAKSFEILSSGLYSDTIKAILRELSCNAYDSHVAAGKADIQFDLHLPTVFEPYFYIRDYGVGLSVDEVKTIFTTYFESTKTESNEYVGALGLGSKVPFSYTDNFTITSIKNGRKSIFTAFITDNGTPAVAQVYDDLSDEPTGVEIRFSIIQDTDIWNFKSKAKEVFNWFPVKPNFIGEAPTIAPGYNENEKLLDNVYLSYGSSCVVMGNIAYPISSVDIPKNMVQKLGYDKDVTARILRYFDKKLCIFVNIGDVDFAASREKLQYTRRTVAKLIEIAENIEKHILDIIHEKIYHKNPRMMVSLISSLNTHSTSLYEPSVVGQYLKEKTTDFPFKYESRYSVYFEPFEYSTEKLRIDYGVEVSYCTKSRTNKIVPSKQYYSSSIPCGADFKILDNENEKIKKSHIDYHFGTQLLNAKNVLIFSKIKDSKIYDLGGALKYLHFDDNFKVYKEEDIIKPHKRSYNAASNRYNFYTLVKNTRGWNSTYDWVKRDNNILGEFANKKMIYFELKGFELKDYLHNPKSVYSNFVDTSYKLNSNYDMIFIRDLEKHTLPTTWISFGDFLEQEKNKVPGSLVSLHVSNSWFKMFYDLQSSDLKLLSPEVSALKTRVTNFVQNPTMTESNVNFLSIYDTDISKIAKDEKQKINDDLYKFMKKYPMSEFVIHSYLISSTNKSANLEKLKDYINVIDERN